MKAKDVVLGEIYWMRVSRRIVPVCIYAKNPYGGYTGINMITRRYVRLRTAGRIRAMLSEVELNKYGYQVDKIQIPKCGSGEESRRLTITKGD